MARQTYKSLGLTIFLLFIICIIVGLFGVKPLWGKYKTSKSDLDAVSEQNDKLKQAQAAMQDFISSYASKQQQVSTANLALPSKNDDMPDFIGNLNNLAAQSGVVLANFGVTYPATDSASGTIVADPVSFSANGSFP